jgi:uncharacterized protein (DUF1501 family)
MMPIGTGRTSADRAAVNQQSRQGWLTKQMDSLSVGLRLADAQVPDNLTVGTAGMLVLRR